MHGDRQNRGFLGDTDLLDPVLDANIAHVADAALDDNSVVACIDIVVVRKDVPCDDGLDVVAISGGGKTVGGGVTESNGLGAGGDGARVRVARNDGRAPGVGGGGVDGGAVAVVGVADGVLRDVGGDELALGGDGVGRGGGGRRNEGVGGGGGSAGGGGALHGAVKTGKEEDGAESHGLVNERGGIGTGAAKECRRSCR